MSRDDGVDYSGYFLKNFKDKNVNYQNDYYKYYSPDDEIVSLGTPIITDGGKRANNENDYYYRNQRAKTVVEVPNVKKRKGNRRRMTRPRLFLFTVSLIVLCFCITIVVADTLSGGYILNSLQASIVNRNKVDTTYYGVEMISFSDYNSARVFAQQLRQQGGAGYVVEDEVYRVIAELYDTEEEALSVLKKLPAASGEAKIYKIEIPIINYANFPSSTRNLVKNIMPYAQKTHSTLFAVSVALSQKEIDEANAISKITSLKNEIQSMLTDFESGADNNVEDKNVFKVRLELLAVVAGLENLCNKNISRPNLLCDIRYTGVMCINSFRALCSGLA